MKSIGLRFMVAALAVLLGSAIASSQTADTTPPPMHAGMRGPLGMDGHMIQFYAKYLGVTDEQKTQMKATLQKERPDGSAADAAATPTGPAAQAV